MNVLIIGAGQVGRSVAQALAEKHDVTVVDKDPARLDQVRSSTDASTFEGNGVRLRVLKSAGVETANRRRRLPLKHRQERFGTMRGEGPACKVLLVSRQNCLCLGLKGPAQGRPVHRRKLAGGLCRPEKRPGVDVVVGCRHMPAHGKRNRRHETADPPAVCV